MTAGGFPGDIPLDYERKTPEKIGERNERKCRFLSERKREDMAQREQQGDHRSASQPTVLNRDRLKLGLRQGFLSNREIPVLSVFLFQGNGRFV